MKPTRAFLIAGVLSLALAAGAYRGATAAADPRCRQAG